MVYLLVVGTVFVRGLRRRPPASAGATDDVDAEASVAPSRSPSTDHPSTDQEAPAAPASHPQGA